MNKKLGTINKHIPLNGDLVKDYVMLLCDHYESGLYDINNISNPFRDRIYITFSDNKTVVVPENEQREAIRLWNERPANSIIPYIKGTIENFKTDLIRVTEEEDETEEEGNNTVYLILFIFIMLVAAVILVTNLA